jgi:acyl-coenzyme A synthetase/AMP-(fatty) acid ligase
MINCYGPTEATYVCISKEIRISTPCDGPHFPIGRPHNGVQSILLDETGVSLKEADADQEGELAVAGPQIARGYWMRPEEQARAFVMIDGTRYYRTGDICRRNAAGEFVFCRRADEETKINGYRVNMSEVRAALLANPNVAQCVVFPLAIAGGEKAIACALHLRESPTQEGAIHVQRTVRERLPAYMVPKFILVIPKVPLLASGKEDVGAASRMLHQLASDSSHQIFVLSDNQYRHFSMGNAS